MRDWVDVIACSERIQHIGYLAWAACGKDPGYSPAMILTEARRSGRYSAAEVSQLAFDGPTPDARELSVRFATMLEQADDIIEELPAREIGKAVLDENGELFRGGLDTLTQASLDGRLRYHPGSIRGAFPSILG